MESPRTSYEYSSAVQTANYQNYQAVKSDAGGLRVAPVVQTIDTPILLQSNAPALELRPTVIANNPIQYLRNEPRIQLLPQEIVAIRNAESPILLQSNVPAVSRVELRADAPIVQTVEPTVAVQALAGK